MKTIAMALVLAALALSACGPSSGDDKDLKAAKARALVIAAGPTGPVYATTGTIVSTDKRTVTIDHEGAAGSPLAAGRTTFRTWADVIALSPGEPGARVSLKVQKLADGWAVVALTAR